MQIAVQPGSAPIAAFGVPGRPAERQSEATVTPTGAKGGPRWRQRVSKTGPGTPKNRSKIVPSTSGGAREVFGYPPGSKNDQNSTFGLILKQCLDKPAILHLNGTGPTFQVTHGRHRGSGADASYIAGNPGCDWNWTNILGDTWTSQGFQCC